MNRSFALLGALAVVQLAIPVQAFPAHPVMVALCSGGAPIPLPMKNHDPEKQCCKICHSAMRRRGGADTCCSQDEGEAEE